MRDAPSGQRTETAAGVVRAPADRIDRALVDPAAVAVSRAGEAAEVRITCENVPSGIGAEEHRKGIGSTLANLAELTEQARTR